jgi:DNA-directed RNA polymerase subunit RPC12/RpoP
MKTKRFKCPHCEEKFDAIKMERSAFWYIDTEGQETHDEEAEDGKYYCPGCGEDFGDNFPEDLIIEEEM